MEEFAKRMEDCYRQMKPFLEEENGEDLNEVFKERLFKGMSLTLRNSIQHLKGEITTYGMLLRSAQKAEEERKKIEISLKETIQEYEGKEISRKIDIHRRTETRRVGNEKLQTESR